MAPATAPQAGVIDFLSNPDNHKGATTIQRIDTHAAIIFLAGPYAIKIKRAVKYPFLDFSTLEKRHQACVHEIEVNQANAPQIYISTVAITRQPDNKLQIDGTGKVIEWAVLMHRFDENQTLEKIVEIAPLSDSLSNSLAREMALIHERAPRRPATPWIKNLRQYLNHNTNDMARYSKVFPIRQANRLTTESIANFQQIKHLLEQRAKAGHVRLCHGDAHLGNIVLLDGKPVFFDAIEFSDDIATSDVLYDLAFLLMDLWHRRQHRTANKVFNRYLIESQDNRNADNDHYSGLAALPLFMMMRAMIRARVTAARCAFVPEQQHAGLIAQAKEYFSTARHCLKNTPPRLIAIGGLSGTGKSTIAASIAADIGRSPGAVIIRSDIIRKKLFNTKETDHLPQSAYTSQTHQLVYEQLNTLAARILQTGQSVIIDAVFARQNERDAISNTSQTAGVPFSGIWLSAPEHILISRVSSRRNDASDADETIVKKQLTYDHGPISWIKIDASGKPDDITESVITRLKL